MARLRDLGTATVILSMMDCRATGKQAAKPMDVRRRFALLAERDWLLARIAAAPDLTGKALLAELAGCAGRPGELRRGAAYPAGNGSANKTLRAAELDRPDVACKRECWNRYQRRISRRD